MLLRFGGFSPTPAAAGNASKHPALNRFAGSGVWSHMSHCRILYFRGGILEETELFTSEDLVEAARIASSHRPELTAEIWRKGRKVAIVRPSWAHDSSRR